MRPGTIDYQASVRRSFADRLRKSAPPSQPATKDAQPHQQPQRIRKPRQRFGGDKA